MADSQHGTIINLQRFSIHDGPGIRTLVFMKGCPLRCRWCANPESQKRDPQLGWIASRCAGCGKCIDACPNNAIQLVEEIGIVTDRTRCTACGACAAVCLYDAREIAGREMTIPELIDEVEKDREFYANSGGGVTVGGGEPLVQHAFVRAFLEQCHERWMNTALETCGHGPWAHLRDILQHVDFLFYDLKHVDPVVHRRITGVSNERILSNLEKIDCEPNHLEVVVRMPIVTGINDDEAHIQAAAKYLSGLRRVRAVELLPYHRLGISKYAQFGMAYQLADVAVPDSDQMKRLEGILREFGLETFYNTSSV